MGGGFCAVSPMPDSAPGLFTFFLVAAFGYWFCAGDADDWQKSKGGLPVALCRKLSYCDQVPAPMSIFQLAR